MGTRWQTGNRTAEATARTSSSPVPGRESREAALLLPCTLGLTATDGYLQKGRQSEVPQGEAAAGGFGSLCPSLAISPGKGLGRLLRY